MHKVTSHKELMSVASYMKDHAIDLANTNNVEEDTIRVPNVALNYAKSLNGDVILANIQSFSKHDLLQLKQVCKQRVVEQNCTVARQILKQIKIHNELSKAERRGQERSNDASS